MSKKHLIRELKYVDYIDKTELVSFVSKYQLLSGFVKRELKVLLNYVDILGRKYDYYSTKVVYRCLFSNKSRWVLRFFKLSRMCIKESVNKGILLGIRRASW